MSETKDFIRGIPKVLLHDHLDGGVRIQTVIDLAVEQGYNKLPSTDIDQLTEWFHRGAQRGSLPMYLECFEHTCGVMQDLDALERIAYETIEDMKLDGVFYLETRFAPLLHIEKGIKPDDVVLAVLKGLERGKKDFGVHFGLILVALRSMTPENSLQIAQLAVQFRDQGVVGFDFAGCEKGFPPVVHIDAFNHIQENHFNITIHAGEGFGLESIRQAVEECGAHRIGHGTKLIEDIIVNDDGSIESMGTLSQYILNKRIPLEMCLTSNLHTGTVSSLESHPFKLLHDNQFRVTLNTDDRLMSGITLTDEYYLAHTMYQLSVPELFKITVNSMKSAFLNYGERKRIIEEILEPEYKALLNNRIATTAAEVAITEIDDHSIASVDGTGIPDTSKK